MFSKTLVVCLLALFCLQITLATQRLNTRIAGQFESSEGQFPYIAFITYNYVDVASGVLVSQQNTGIIYNQNAVITTAKTFDNFPAGGANLTIAVGAYEVNNPTAFFTYFATIGRYQVPTDNTTTPPTAPTELINIPTQYTPGATNFDIAIVRLQPPSVFAFNNVVKIANFPTSSPIQADALFAVAYGNQGPGSITFPTLKFAQMFFKKPVLCQNALSNASVAATFNRNQHFCVQSQDLTKTANIFEGVCSLDVSGAIVRTSDITNSTIYYEVVGLITYAADTTTCDKDKRVPAIIIYLSYFQDKFFTPILGSLAANNNGQDPAQNPNSFQGNFICGNGILEGPERCDIGSAAPSTFPCCAANTCTFKPQGKLCESKANKTKNVCLTRLRCKEDGSCTATPRDQGKKCAGKQTACRSGVCNKCVNQVCTPL
jgi:hypothetical protein